jgi:surface protein
MPSNFNNQELTEIKFNGVDVSEAYFNGVLVFDANQFVSTWRTTTANETIYIPTSTFIYVIDWGDGTVTNNTNFHEYAIAGDYEIKISGEINDFAFNNTGDKDKILEVSNFGRFISLDGGFYGCSSLDITANDTPIINGLSSLFHFCSSLVYNSSINNWDMTPINNIKFLFFGCTNFNQNINDWDVSSVVDGTDTFNACTNYNQPLNNWDVENFQSTSQMFLECSNFNQNINDWRLLSCADVGLMFYNCENFNQPLNNWVTTSFQKTYYLFFGCTNFNQNINSWDTQNFNTLWRIFRSCTNYNQPLNNWDTSNVTDMVECFYFCTSFNQPVDSWSFVSVVTMSNFMLGKTSNDYNANYLSDLLIKLDQDLVFANMTNPNLGFGTIKYDATSVTAYNSLISKGFIIQSGGQV